MSLTNLEDLMGPGLSDPNRSTWELVMERIHDERRPMPPEGILDDEELAMFGEWVDAGLPENARECRVRAANPYVVGPELLPCEVTASVQAFGHDGPESPYEVSPTTGNELRCFVFDSPFGEGAQMTGFAPIIDDDRVVHHWILYGTRSRDRVPGTHFDCTNEMPTDASFIMGWAPGQANSVMDEDIGFELPGPGTRLLLQVHYWNVPGFTDAVDRTGVAICATDGPERPHTAGIHTTGSIYIDIPPRTESWSTNGHCHPAITEETTLMATSPHMHEYGRSFVMEVHRGDDPDQAERIIELDSWSFNRQGEYLTPMLLYPGDSIHTSCTYSNPTDERIVYGDRTEDEMCFGFLSAYPAGQLVTEPRGRIRRLCFDELLD
jgi:hypothetical protein